MQSARHKEVEEVIQDQNGRILGKYSARRNLMLEEIDFVRRFLQNITSQKGVEIVASENIKVNQVKLAGIVKSIKNEEDTSGFVLVDSETQDSRYIPCTVYQSKELMTNLRTFKTDDYIQIVGMIRAWSKKTGERTFENRVEVRITEIKNTGTAKNGAGKRKVSDDGLPF